VPPHVKISNLVILGQTVRVYILDGKNPSEENELLMFRLWRSLTVTGTDSDHSAIYNFLLLLHSNNELISYHFWGKLSFW